LLLQGNLKYLCVQGEQAKDLVIGKVVRLKLTPKGEVGPYSAIVGLFASWATCRACESMQITKSLF
jgi:hypothetical protein